MESDLELRPIAHRERKRAARVLAAAFSADSDFREAFAQATPLREFHLRIWFGLHLALAVAAGRMPLALFEKGRMVAALSYIDPAGFEPPESLTSLAGLRVPTFWFRHFGHQGFQEMIQRYGDVARSLGPEEPHDSVTAVGVLSGSRRQGYGRRLIQEIVSASSTDPKSAGVCIETYSASNAAFYQRLGFGLTKRSTEGAVPVFSMFLRHPR